MDAADELYTVLEEKGFEVLMDDRDERADKYKDRQPHRDPLRIVIGEKNLKEGSKLKNAGADMWRR